MRRLILAILAMFAVATSAAAQTFTISPPPFLTAFDNSGKIINGSCVWTYSAGTTTPATTYSDNLGTTNSNPIKTDSAGRFTAFLQVGVSYKFVYESACTPPAHGSVLRTADNIAAMPTASASVDITTAVAGESITAGQAVYLSDGSGGKTAGHWYKADVANAYSSTVNWVGIATQNIASGATGTVRMTGAVTGLSSLSVGAIYYVGTGGAITTTAPTNVRKLGQADTTTTLVLTGDPPPYAPVTFVDDFRLSLTTATCVTTGDVTAATTLYFTPCTGNRMTLFDGSGTPETCTTGEVSIAVPATTATLYDVWAYDSAFGTCTVTLELLLTTRTDTTGLTRVNGRWTKTGNSSRMYVGTFRTTAVSGQTEDSAKKRYVWNTYNRAPRSMKVREATASWTYSIETFQQANAAATNQLDFVIGLNETTVQAFVSVAVENSGAGTRAEIGIGLDSTTTQSADSTPAILVVPAAARAQSMNTQYLGYPGVGRHTLVWLEAAEASGITTWIGTGYPLAQSASGLWGIVWG